MPRFKRIRRIVLCLRRGFIDIRRAVLEHRIIACDRRSERLSNRLSRLDDLSLELLKRHQKLLL